MLGRCYGTGGQWHPGFWQVKAFSSRAGQRGEHGSPQLAEGRGLEGTAGHRDQPASPVDRGVRGSLRVRAKFPQKEGSDREAGREKEGRDLERKVVGLRGRPSDGLWVTGCGPGAKCSQPPGSMYEVFQSLLIDRRARS